MEYAVQGAQVAPTSTMPSGHPHLVAVFVIALSMALTAITGLSVAPVLAFQTTGTDSSVVAPPAAAGAHPKSTGTRSVSHHAPVRDTARKPASSGPDRTHRQPTSRPSTKPHVTPHVASSASQSQGRRIVRLAASHIGAHFQIGATGMRYFDCSGLIYRVYAQAGLLAKIGGNHTAAGYYYWFKQRGLANRHSPKAGDLVIWTEKGQIAHSGIYVGGGRVISALINPWGVKKTHINTIHAKFLAYLHVRW
jgi:cell wall-associated NlpC family hydrolase